VKTGTNKDRFLATTLLAGVAIFAGAGAANAQSAAPTTTPPNSTTSSSSTSSSDDTGGVIVVTGSMIRGNVNSVSPLTVVDQANLDARGISTTQDALQKLSANNGPALTNSFTANGAFAGGASGVSLRGLSTNSTLVLFDGMRAAYYPLADDGSRNFVDLNTIPDDVVDHIDVLRDGASSSYGADAIAGVVNIVTKREFQGASMRLEGGMSSRGDAQESRASITLGAGDLHENGVNAYISLFHYKSDALYDRDRGFPYNSSNLSNLCNGSNCGGDLSYNANVAAGFSSVGAMMFRPYTVSSTGVLTAVPGSRYQAAQAGCPGGGVSRAVSSAELTANPAAPDSICTYDEQALWGQITPDIDRWGGTVHAAFDLPNEVSAYFEANFLQTTSSYYDIIPPQWSANAPTGINYPQFSTSQQAGTLPFAAGSFLLNLPVWVCSERVHCGDPSISGNAADSILNPNNPYASQGYVARILGIDRSLSAPFNSTRDRSYRLAGGANGTFGNGWDWDISATAMHTDLQRLADGYIYIQHMLDVIADGTYNFADPSQAAAVPWAQDPAAVHNYLAPADITDATSDLMQVQGTVNIPLFQLPGGQSTLAVGASWMYEAVDAPSENDDINGPTQRYFRLNAFGTAGNRREQALFFEYDAPVFDTVDVNLSGRYDDYSTGQSHFSPKIGVRWKPLDLITLRSTYSEGFRIPSFGEANALPTTGYVTNNSGLFNDTYLSQYGCTVATFSSCPTYIRQGSYGLTTLASPNLKPEESKSWTAGFILQPLENLSIAVDYYSIEKTGAITSANASPAIDAYYSGQAIPAGYVVIPDAPDPNHLSATPRIAFVQSSLVNANTIKSRGWDFAINYSHDLPANVHWTSSLDASYISLLETVFPDGSVERYDGTLGNFNLTAGSGTPSWHGDWVNTFSTGMFDISATVNYFSGYNLSAQDQGTGYKDCGLDPGYSPTGCNVDAAITYDLNVQAHLNEKATLYVSVLNLTDEMPPVDVTTYGAWNYNPVQGGDMILGRYFKAGVKLDF